MIHIGNESVRPGGISRLLRSGVSIVALCVMSAAAPALAQDGSAAPAAQDDTQDPAAQDDAAIVVTGIRASLANSQNIKRNSDTVVDAITAQDIGALPDRSVTEALQRVPGVAMNRFAGSNDPDHFSVEGSGVVVRGLSFVRSEFNGRDTFSTGVYGQAINFADVPAELLGSVEVYKNATAEMTEGGLSGTVNLNTRLPFQGAKGFHLSVDAEGSWGDMAKKWAPTGSILVSNTWDSGIGKIGVLGSFSYSQIKSRADGIQVTNIQTRDNQFALASNSDANNVCRNPLPSNSNTTTLPPGWDSLSGTPPCGTFGGAGSDGLADLSTTPLYAPVGGQFRTQDYNRQRKGYALAAQWESLDRRALLTAQFLRSDSTSKWGEHTFESAPDLADYNTYPAGCLQNQNGPGRGPGTDGTVRAECPVGSFQNYQYDDEGIFEKGYITFPGTGWRTGSSGQATTRVPTGGIQQSLSRREVDDRNIVNDYGLNFKFTPDDHWQFNVDAQYVKAAHDTLDMSVFGSTFADNELDLTGNLPRVIAHKPMTLSAAWATPNPTMVAQNDEQYFKDPQWTFWRAAMDHIEESRGKEVAFKGDVAYNFNNDGFLKRAKFGARYADRDQTVRFTTYNWGAISEIWSGTQVSMAQAGGDKASFYDFPDFFRGKTPGPVGGYYFNGSLIEGYRGASDFFKSLNDIWHTTNGATATNRWVPAAARAGVIPGTPFLPSEIQQVSERNMNGYAMLTFGDDDLFGDIGLDGNIGIRFVDTKVDSLGSFAIPTRATVGVSDPFSAPGGTGRCDPQPPPANAPPGTPPSTPGGICNLGAAGYAQLQTFANGASFLSNATNKYQYWLPSLNLKFGLTDELILRFAASRALARPSMADIRNFVTVAAPSSSAPTILTATAGNPFLKPALSDQFDVSLEWYFAKVGSLTFDAFYKNVHNFFYQDVVRTQVTNNGVTVPLDIRGPANYDGTGKVKGFEVAYQHTWDFLPGFLSGFGINASYTFIKSKGLPNSRLNGGAPVSNSPIGVAGNLPLEQLSKHNFNVALFYEKGPISLRAAYNWRSKFLLTSADVIIPYFPIFNDSTGQLDASVFVNITKEVKVGVQAVNLTNEVTKTLQQFTLDGKLGPRSYFMNDRRFAVIARASF
jgi:TonB-dependent receptor